MERKKQEDLHNFRKDNYRVLIYNTDIQRPSNIYYFEGLISYFISLIKQEKYKITKKLLTKIEISDNIVFV